LKQGKVDLEELMEAPAQHLTLKLSVKTRDSDMLTGYLDSYWYAFFSWQEKHSVLIKESWALELLNACCSCATLDTGLL
jgi:hypothetical protein